MAYKILWVLVEGSDDKKFINNVITNIFENKYSYIKPYEYRQKPTKTVKAFINSIDKMDFADYFFLRDINDSPCVSASLETINTRYAGRIDITNIIIVVKEIESWYLAGLDDKACEELEIRPFQSTDNITKEGFDDLRSGKFDSRIDFMAEILKRFSVETAKQKNKSFDFFMKKTQVA